MILILAFLSLQPFRSDAGELVKGSFTSQRSQSPSLSATQEFDCGLGSIARVAVNSAIGKCQSTVRPEGELCAIKPVKTSTSKKPASCSFPSPVYEVGKKRTVLFDQIVDSAPDGKSECSHLVSGILCASGARQRPNDDACKQANTKEMVEWDDINSCFAVMEFSAAEQLKPGCLIVWNNGRSGHVLIVDRVGQNPFGRGETCDMPSQTASDWNFEVVESIQPNGPEIAVAKNRFSASSGWDNSAMKALGVLACQVRTTGRVRKATVKTAAGDTLKVLCHKATSECLGPKRKFKHQECVSDCQ
jgi:hypothetical protein